MVDDDNVDDNAIGKPKTRKRRSAATAKSDVGSESRDIEVEPKKTRRSASSKAISTLNSLETKDVGATGEIIGPVVVPPKKVKPPAHQVITEKDEIPKLWNSEKAAANGSYSKFYEWKFSLDGFEISGFLHSHCPMNQFSI
jgi:hypothetical protein